MLGVVLGKAHRSCLKKEKTSVKSAFFSGLLLALLALQPFAQGAQPTQWEPRGVGGGGAFFCPSLSTTNENELYITTDMGDLYHSTDFGASYTVVNFTQCEGGHLAQVAFTSDPNIQYCLSGPAKTTDDGTTWSAITDPSGGNGCNYIFADPNSTTNLLISDRSNLYFSGDGGQTFNSVYNDTNSNLFIAGAFFDGANIYVGTIYGMLVSTDTGNTFNMSTASGLSGEIISFTGAKSSGVTSLFCLTAPSGTVSAGEEMQGIYDNNPLIINSTNVYNLIVRQNSWTQCANGLPSGETFAFIAMSLIDTQVVYVSGLGNDGYNFPLIYLTTDGGNTWNEVLGTDMLTNNNQNVIAGWDGWKGDQVYWWGGGSIGFAVSPLTPDIAASSDMGFFHMTTSQGALWQEAYTNIAYAHPAGTYTPTGQPYQSVGLDNTGCWDMAWSDANNIFVGFSDIVAIRSTDAGQTWAFNWTVNGSSSANSIWHCFYRIVKHPNGNLYACISTLHDLYESWVISESSINIWYYGLVLFSTDDGATWTPMYGLDSNGNPNGSPVFWVEPDPSNPNRMFASIANSTNGGIYVCNDINDGANAVWTMLNQPPRTLGHPGVITFLDDGTLLCSFEACYTGVFTASSGVFSGVYNASTGQMTWTDCCANYPNMQYYTKDVVVDPNDSTQNTWYAGVCDGWGGNGNDMGGLYKTTNRGQSWTRLTNNAGTVSCTFNPSNPAEMYVTTIENGLYYASDANTGTPTFSPVTAYPFRAPRRVYYNPYNNNEVWVLSDGNGIRVGNTSPTATLTTIKVTPGPVAVGAGGQQAFTATAYDQNNNLLSAQPTFSWSVSGGGGGFGGGGAGGSW